MYLSDSWIVAVGVGVLKMQTISIPYKFSRKLRFSVLIRHVNFNNE